MSLMREYPVAWQTNGSAVPIMSKVKLLPSIPKANGQLFLKNPLKTPAWSVSFRMSFNQDTAMMELSDKEMVDMFAFWFLLTEPHIREGAIEHEKVFGLNNPF